MSVVVGTQRRECTEPMGKVVEVNVIQQFGPGATVEASSRKDVLRIFFLSSSVINKRLVISHYVAYSFLLLYQSAIVFFSSS